MRDYEAEFERMRDLYIDCKDQLTTANKRIEVLEEAVNKSVKDYKSRKMTYGWHDLQNKMFEQALAKSEELKKENL